MTQSEQDERKRERREKKGRPCRPEVQLTRLGNIAALCLSTMKSGIRAEIKEGAEEDQGGKIQFIAFATTVIKKKTHYKHTDRAEHKQLAMAIREPRVAQRSRK